MMLQAPPRNRLLAALPEAEWDLLRPCLTRVDLKPRQVLQHPHTPVEHAYFVERGAVTFQARTEAEGPVGFGLVDGGALIGLPVVLGTMRSHLRALVEVGPGQPTGSAPLICAGPCGRARSCTICCWPMCMRCWFRAPSLSCARASTGSSSGSRAGC